MNLEIFDISLRINSMKNEAILVHGTFWCKLMKGVMYYRVVQSNWDFYTVYSMWHVSERLRASSFELLTRYYVVYTPAEAAAVDTPAAFM